MNANVRTTEVLANTILIKYKKSTLLYPVFGSSIIISGIWLNLGHSLKIRKTFLISIKNRTSIEKYAIIIYFTVTIIKYWYIGPDASFLQFAHGCVTSSYWHCSWISKNWRQDVTYIEKYVRYPALSTYSTQGFKGTYRTRPFKVQYFSIFFSIFFQIKKK